jgi:hypothetical protein
MPTRRRGPCSECGKLAEIAGHGLCFACYRRAQRAGQNEDSRDGITVKQKRRMRQYTAVLAGLADLGVTKSDAIAIATRLAPYVSDVTEYLNPRGLHSGESEEESD